MQHKAERLRELFSTQPLVRVAGAHDGLSAKLVERHGYDAIWASSFGISTCHGVPDASILTMSEFLATAVSMAEVVDLPIIADCDCGFGDAAIVAHMARKYQAGGIAAVCIEDKPFPKTNSFIDGHQKLANLDEFCGKIAAAVEGREDGDLVIIARIEALIAGCGQAEALRRAEAYADAGADAILIHSKQRTPDEVFAFARAWKRPVPLVAIPTSYYHVTDEQMRDAGIGIVIYANQAIRSAVRAMDQALRRIRRAGTTEGVEGQIAPMRELFELQGMSKIRPGH